MLTRKEVQLKLLQKLNELCNIANVKYVLHGHAAFLGYYNKSFEEVNSLEVLMCQGDAEKISNILDDDSYYFEDFRTNPKFDRHYMLFGFKNSIDLKNKDLNFNRTRHIKNHCIRITIHFIEQPANRLTGKILKKNRKLSKIRYMNINSNYKNYRNKQKFWNKLINSIGNDFYNKQIYNFKKNKISIDTWTDIGNYPLVKITGKKPVESNIFKEITNIKLDNVDSYIFNDFEKYALHYYGRKWEEKLWPKLNSYTSTIISWDEISNDVDVKQSISKIQKNYELIYENREKTKECRKIIRNMKKHVKQSGSVIHTREDFINRKDEIIKLYKTGSIEELEFVLKPLIQSMQNGIHRGYTYSVDKDIDNILDSYLREVNRDKLADKIEEYRIDI